MKDRFGLNPAEVSEHHRSGGGVSPQWGPAISAQKVDFFYGDFQALRDVSLDLAPRRISALIGPSGCGKSTFLRLLNRMNDAVTGARMNGRILVGDQSIYDPGTDPVDVRRKVGMVFQKPNPFPKSIYDNICYGPRLVGIKKAADLDQITERALRAAALWEEVKDSLDKSALALSGGQQQRVCIARSLALSPDVLLMDEPTSALDPIATAKIEEWIKEAARELTIVIVTHNMQQAARVSDATAFFYLGELVEFGATKELFTNPVNKRTENYITGRFG